MAKGGVILKVTLEPGFLQWRFWVIVIIGNTIGTKYVPGWLFKTETVDQCQ